jgi:hypothetical protein
VSDRTTSLDLTPTPGGCGLEAARAAVALAGVELDTLPVAYTSSWRAAALREGVEHAPGPPTAAAPANATSVAAPPGG